MELLRVILYRLECIHIQSYKSKLVTSAHSGNWWWFKCHLLFTKFRSNLWRWWPRDRRRVEYIKLFIWKAQNKLSIMSCFIRNGWTGFVFNPCSSSSVSRIQSLCGHLEDQLFENNLLVKEIISSQLKSINSIDSLILITDEMKSNLVNLINRRRTEYILFSFFYFKNNTSFKNES